MRRPLTVRFWERADCSGDGCWEWQGAHQPSGYGNIQTDLFGGPRKTELAHRVAYRLANGPFDGSLCVCHHCDNKRCVRPDHLFLGTKSDNTQDMIRKGFHPNQQKDHCKQGHEYTEENTFRTGPNRRRHCRECGRIASLAFYHRKRTEAHL